MTIIMPDGHQLVVKRRVQARRGPVKYDGVLVDPEGQGATQVESESAEGAFDMLFCLLRMGAR